MGAAWEAIISSDWNECLAPCGPFDCIAFNFPEFESDLADIFRRYTDNQISLGEAAGKIKNLLQRPITPEQMDAPSEDYFWHSRTHCRTKPMILPQGRRGRNRNTRGQTP